MTEKHWMSRFGAIACACVSLAAGCTSSGETTLGGRPLIYKNAPSDEVEVKAGIVRKRSAADEEAERPAPRAAAQPAPRRDSEPATVASAQPSSRAPTAAPESEFFNRYTQATRYGDLYFVSGQIGVDPRTGQFDSGKDIEAQTRQALANIRSILEANRLTMANVVSTTVYISNISRLGAMDAVYNDFFSGTPPARTVVEVSNLTRGALVEISLVAGR